MDSTTVDTIKEFAVYAAILVGMPAVAYTFKRSLQILTDKENERDMAQWEAEAKAKREAAATAEKAKKEASISEVERNDPTKRRKGIHLVR